MIEIRNEKKRGGYLMSKWKRLLLSSVTLGSLGLLAACGGGGETDTTDTTDTTAPADEEVGAEETTGSGSTLGVSFYQYADTYISSVRQALEEVAGGDGSVEMLLNDAQGDQATQNDQLDVLTEQGVGALAVNIVDVGAVQTVLDKAQESDLPIIFFNREPDQSILQGYENARFVGTTPEEAGILQGEMAAEMWEANPDWDKNGDGVMNYVMLTGDAENPEAIARTEYSVSTVEEMGIETNELGQQVANWNADQAYTAVSAWISREGENIEMIFSNNDSMASGAISALQSAGFNDGSGPSIPIFGVDATDEAKQLIADGYMTGTIEQDAQGMAEAIYALSKNALEGNDFLEGTDYEYDDTGISVRIPYQKYSGE